MTKNQCHILVPLHRICIATAVTFCEREKKTGRQLGGGDGHFSPLTPFTTSVKSAFLGFKYLNNALHALKKMLLCHHFLLRPVVQSNM